MAKKPNAREAAQTEAEAETAEILGAPEPAKKKRGGNVEVMYIDGEGKEVKSMPEVAIGIVTRVGKDEATGKFGTYGERVTKFAELSDNIRSNLLAFGARTAAQNAVNTAESVADGWEAFERRFGNFSAGKWAEAGAGGGGIPTFLHAFKRAGLEAGKDAETVEAKFAELCKLYEAEGLEDKEATKVRKELRQKLMAIPAVEAAFYKIQEEAIAARKAKMAQASTSGDAFAGLL